MTTEKKSENTPTPAANDNKAVFGPLGKYAVIAVIMVSIIVTTAIMLDRQLKTVDEQIAAIEEEVAEIHAANTDTSADEATPAKLTAVEPATAPNAAIEVAEIKKEAASETIAAPIVTDTIEITAAEVPVTQEAAAITEANHNATQANSATAAQFEMATAETSVRTRQAQQAKENQARIDAYKLEQKQYMSDVFARIKALESQQLNRYKANQDGQIVRLREQISQQQRMIDTLVLRNKDLFELRAANMQRNQANREQRLNRI